MNKKIMSIGSSLILGPTLALTGCSGMANGQSVEAACNVVKDGITTVGTLPDDSTADELMAKMKEIGEDVTNKEVKDLWERMVGDSEVIYLMADKLRDTDPEDLTEKEIDKLAEEYAKGMENFEASFNSLTVLCPVLKDDLAELEDKEEIVGEEEITNENGTVEEDVVVDEVQSN